jgi:D-serine deaminase-like pyridoxal phosphate-dependent protein
MKMPNRRLQHNAIDLERHQGQALADIQTPAALIDPQRLKRNTARMHAVVRVLGSRLRPHMKTLKSAEAAEIALDPLHRGIAVSTLNEARYFSERGFSDICCAICLTPQKFSLAAQLAETGTRLSFFADNPYVVRAMADHGGTFEIWIEIDSGEHRTGIEPESPALLEIAHAIRAGRNTTLMGVATHAGHSYACRSVADIRRVAEQERQAAVTAAERLRQAGFAVPNVSVGSTPTTIHAASAAGITEFRAGVYMAGDLVQSSLGSLELDDIAFSVLATVISAHRERRQIVLDAGALALSKDRGTRDTVHDYGYGLVTDLSGRCVFGELTIAEVYQEHGEVHNVPQSIFDRLAVGTRVRILPNHVCMTAAMYDELLVVDCDTQSVQAVWERTNGWS